MEKLAIQRLVRGDDGLTKVIYIDLGTLQQIADLNGYRIVNSGDLYEEPVASVDDPETPSEKEEDGEPTFTEPTGGNNNDSNPNYGGSPLTPNQNVSGPNAPSQPARPGAVTQPGAIRTPESRVPSAVKPSVRETVTPRAPSETSMGPFGGIKTAQGSILSNIDQGRFNQGLQQAVEKAAGIPSVGTQDEGATNGMFGLGEGLSDRAGLATGSTGMFSDSMANLGLAHGQAPKGIGRPASQITSQIAGRPEAPIGSMPAAKASQIGQTNLSGARPEGPAAGMPAAREAAPDVSGLGISRNSFDTNYGIDRGAINAGIMSQDGMPTRPADTISAQQAALPGIQRNAYDIAYGAPKTAAPAKQTSFPGKIADDFAFADQGVTKVNAAEFDTPSASLANKAKDDKSVAKSTIDSAKSVANQAERTTGFASAGPKPGSPRTTTMVDAAGYSQVDRTGTAGWRNNNPGNLEATGWTKSQEGYIGAAGGVEAPGWSRAPDGTMSRFAAFDTYENGLKAQANLIGTKYANHTISGMMAKYAPAFENNTVSYANTIAAAIGVSPDTKISDLSQSQRMGMMEAMHEVEGSVTPGTSRTSLTAKGIDARDNYTGIGTGADTPSERNAASRPSPGSSGSAFSGGGSYGGGGHVGGVANSGMSGASRSTAGKTSTSGIGRGSSGGSGGSYGGSSGANAGGGGIGSGKSASGGVSGASRSTSGKGGASPSSKSGGQSGAAQSGTSGKTGGSGKSNPGTSGNMGSGGGTTSGHGAGIGSA